MLHDCTRVEPKFECRPFVEPTGLDHDDGIDGLSTERSTVLRRKGQHIGGIPIFAMAQMQKDKNQHMLNVSFFTFSPIAQCLVRAHFLCAFLQLRGQPSMHPSHHPASN